MMTNKEKKKKRRRTEESKGGRHVARAQMQDIAKRERDAHVNAHTLKVCECVCVCVCVFHCIRSISYGVPPAPLSLSGERERDVNFFFLNLLISRRGRRDASLKKKEKIGYQR